MYTELLYAFIPTLFSYFLLFCYPYIYNAFYYLQRKLLMIDHHE